MSTNFRLILPEISEKERMEKGVLLINSGSPDSNEVEDVKVFLREYFMDPLVLDDPYFLRKMKVEFTILPQRAKIEAEAYKKIGWTEGSPLLVISKRLQKKLIQSTQIPIALGMRYGNPSIQSALQELKDQGVREVLVLPLFPQYTMSTTWTAADKTIQIQSKLFKDLKLTFLNSFYKHPNYIAALVDRINGKLPAEYDKLLFSYQGIPESHERTATQKAKQYKNTQFETYRNQCLETTELVRKELGLPEDKIDVSFQSRMRAKSWIKPYTHEVLKNYPNQGVKKIVVVSPSFVTDGLETLDETSNQGEKIFKSNGGEYFGYIKCLNDNEEWTKVLTQWIKGWQFKDTEIV